VRTRTCTLAGSSRGAAHGYPHVRRRHGGLQGVLQGPVRDAAAGAQLQHAPEGEGDERVPRDLQAPPVGTHGEEV